MNICYLHVGPPEHGLNRYGRLLAEEAKTKSNCSVLEVNAVLGKSWWQNWITLHQAAKQFSYVDIVHFQYNKAIWGQAISILNLLIFAWSGQAQLLGTLHDVYWEHLPFNWSRPPLYLKALYGPRALAFRFLVKQMSRVFVCTEQEFNRLHSVSNLRKVVDEKVVVIPHFVENRNIDIDIGETRQVLGLGHDPVITLLGWIHFRKGHQLLVEALPKLQDNVKVIFAGKVSNGSEGFLNELVEMAKTFEISDRLRITGYLSEADLEKYLAITDIAVCPFSQCSASGSLSTWISISHPRIAAYKIPQIDEYNKLEPGAIHTFDSYDADSLSQLLLKLLSDAGKGENRAINQLCRKLNIANIIDKHISSYQKAYDCRRKKSLKYKST